MHNKYEERIKENEFFLRKFDHISSLVGYAKLFLVFLLIVIVFFLFSRDFSFEFIIAAIVKLIILIIIWIYHEWVIKKAEYFKGIIRIDENNLERISGKWSDFKDFGAEFINLEHEYSSDLDIVGKKSLFQFLNTTHSWYGRKIFAKSLLKPKYLKEELRRRQKAILELSNDINFSNHMEYYYSKISDDISIENLVIKLKSKTPFINNKIIKKLLIYVPILTFVFNCSLIIFRINNLYLFGLLFIFFQILVWLIGITKIHRYLKELSNLSYKLASYSVVIELIKEKEFKSEKLIEIQSDLGLSGVSADKAIKELSRITDKVSVRANGLVYFLLNAFLLWDYECAIAYEKWVAKYAKNSEAWFIALGEFESLLCFSKIPNICSNTCLPEITDSKLIIAQSMGHLLIPNSMRVNNDISCNNSIFIVSGSNMSGKTTFLRTVGINLVLAKAGSFVCAQCMTFPLAKIMASMRIVDDLNEGVSTFYAELKRIKEIVDYAKKDSNTIFLIDEIFRGTNSVDRLSGANTVIERLTELGIIGMITTHDLELCQLESKYQRIKNYSFSEYYKDKKIYFDYTIKQGKSITTNAKYLMEMVGII